MSHITDVKVEVRDLNALKVACKELGLPWMEGQTTHAWYGRFMGDAPVPAGMSPNEYGKCSHAIKVPGAQYEIGVVKSADGKSYTLVYDSWGRSCGQPIAKALGSGLEKLKQHYAVAKAQIEARAKGWSCQKQTLANGTIKMVFTGASL